GVPQRPREPCRRLLQSDDTRVRLDDPGGDRPGALGEARLVQDAEDLRIGGKERIRRPCLDGPAQVSADVEIPGQNLHAPPNPSPAPHMEDSSARAITMRWISEVPSKIV